MVDAIIFDLDGVLIDAREWHYEALNQALALFGYQISRFDHISTYDGLPTRKKLEMLTIEKNLPPGLHNFINHMKQAYTKALIVKNCRPVFTHEYALSRLHHENYKLAICTNSIRPSLELMLDLSRLKPYFRVALSWEDCNRPKPAPDIYLLAFERLGTRPEHAVIVEDNDYGIKAARASGAHVLVVKSPSEVTYDRVRSFIQSVENAQ